jgi:hypothetical protein
LATPPDPDAGAFFDVDNTVMQGASIFHLARGLHRRKFFNSRDIARAAWDQAYFRIVGVEHPEAVANARVSALSFIAGHRVEELESLSEEIFEEAMAQRIWPGTRALAQLHLDQGQRVWLVTAAPVEIARIIAHRLGLTGDPNQVEWHRGAMVARELRRDLRVLSGPVRPQGRDLPIRKELQHFVRSEHQLLVRLAGRAPPGGEIDIDEPSFGPQFLHGRRTPGFPHDSWCGVAR